MSLRPPTNSELYQPSVLTFDTELIESYQRETQLNDTQKQALNLPTDTPVLANVGVESIAEYFVLQAANIPQNQSVTWDLTELGQTIILCSLYIDSPNSDFFRFQILSGTDVIFNLQLGRNKTPYRFPDCPLTPNLKIKLFALRQIDLVRISCKPARILTTLNSVDIT